MLAYLRRGLELALVDASHPLRGGSLHGGFVVREIDERRGSCAVRGERIRVPGGGCEEGELLCVLATAVECAFEGVPRRRS